MLNQKRTVGFIFVPIMLMMALPVWAGGGADRLRGADIVIGNFWEDYDVDTFQPTNEMEARILAYRRRILTEHGFRMSHRQIANWNEMLQTVAISIMAGQPVASAFWLTPAWGITLQRQGLIAPITDNVDFSPKRVGDGRVEWNQSVRNLFTFGGRSYAIGIGYGDSLQASVVFFNKRLFREAGLDPELPYNMQRNRTWTWDNFLPIARQLTRDLDGDGIIDTWAMPADLSTYILDAIVSSNGANFVGRNPNGTFYNASGSPAFLEALQFAMRLMNDGVMMPRPEGSHWNWYMPAFTDGIVAMRVEPLYVRNDLQGMADDWGMVMFPMGPRRNNFVVYTFENVLVIPHTFPPAEVERIVSAIDLWNRPVDESPYAWQDGLWHLFRDARAVTETMAIIRDPSLFMWQYHILIPGLQRGHIAWEMWWHEGDPAQLVEAVSLEWNSLIADVNADLLAAAR
ncbi:MAG: extracellular solute-binding protein [Treponema sp.]|nr:extracellular solute-binding protein [Treponema sp.]